MNGHKRKSSVSPCRICGNLAGQGPEQCPGPPPQAAMPPPFPPPPPPPPPGRWASYAPTYGRMDVEAPQADGTWRITLEGTGGESFANALNVAVGLLAK